MCPGHFEETQRIHIDPDSPKTTRCRIIPGASVDDLTAFDPKAHKHQRSILGHARIHPGTPFTRHGTRGLWGDPESLRQPSSQMPYVAASYQVHPSMFQLLLALRLTGPEGQFLAVPECSSGRHLHGMGSRGCGGYGESPSTQFHQVPSVTTTYWARPLMI